MKMIACNSTNYRAGRCMPVEYIVIHYVGALGGAEDNANYYANHANVSASAHYFAGFDGEIVQSVKESDTAWHCGGGLQGSGGAAFYKKCLNSNSIGIEMCVRKKSTATMSAADRDWYFEQATVKAAQELTRDIMQRYGIDAEHVIRHYDVTGKICPAPFVHDEEQWRSFKEGLEEMTGKEIYEKLNEYLKTQTIPSWAEKELQEAIEAGITDGTDPMQLIPRYQAAIMAKRAVQK